jgi:hypothetical protein
MSDPYLPEGVTHSDIDNVGEPIQGDDILVLQEELKYVQKCIADFKKEEAEILERIENLK